MITTQIQTANFRATLTAPDTFSIKAVTPIAKAYFRYKGHKQGVEASYGDDGQLLIHLAAIEDGVAKLAQI